MDRPWRRALLEALLLLLLGSALGLALNHRLLLEVAAGRSGTPASPAVPEPAAYPEPVALDELRQLLAGGALAIDARVAELYAEGHLPGAFPLSPELAQAGGLGVKLPRDRVLVVYCSGYGCEDSLTVARLLLAAGFREVRVFEGGFPAWQEAGLPVEREGR